ncbi:hypothetical protein ILUMI_09648 [Ignelater luminosus]|uniref:Uncharacterized protein n=1 Tax=Ignelater luminosus TaxID=2038154 RepID=A0A8K0CZD0_IGNLU|nr:hypothetical protein ILUMI_09648 [Ignelater luminosus]
MKCLIICSILLAGALAFERWGPGESECANKLNVKREEIEDISYPAPLDNIVLNDFTECRWKKRGLLSDDGEVNWDTIRNLMLSKDYMEAARLNELDIKWVDFVNSQIDKCRNIRGDTHGQTVVKVENCFFNSGN